MNTWNLENIEAALDSFLYMEKSDDPKYRKQQRILNAAADLFVRYGYRKTSMDDVARQAGVAKGTLYLYFKTKADLMVQVVVLEKKRFIAEMKPLFEEPDPVERLRKYVSLAVTLAKEMPITSRLATGDTDMLDLMEEIDEETRARSDEFAMAIITSFIDEAAGPGNLVKEDLYDMATVLKSILYFTLQMSDERLVGEMKPERFAEVLSRIVVHGLAGKGICKPEKRGLK